MGLSDGCGRLEVELLFLSTFRHYTRGYTLSEAVEDVGRVLRGTDCRSLPSTVGFPLPTIPNSKRLTDQLPDRLVENYCILASTGEHELSPVLGSELIELFAALLWFDFALTFSTEVRRIWARKFSGATLVYLLTRYTAIIDRILFVTEVLLWSSSDEVGAREHSAGLVRARLTKFVPFPQDVRNNLPHGRRDGHAELPRFLRCVFLPCKLALF